MNYQEKSPQQILQRLDELRKWQEQQQQLLIQRQNSQRLLLSEEQRNLYEKLGFSNSLLKNRSASSTASHSSALNESGSIAGLDIDTLPTDGAEIPKDKEEHGSLAPSAKSSGSEVRKRPFLKKGEGLTSRFKVDPDKFRLHNLPKYKYLSRIKERLQSRLPEKLPKKFTSCEPFIVKTSLKRPENEIKQTQTTIKEKIEELGPLVCPWNIQNNSSTDWLQGNVNDTLNTSKTISFKESTPISAKSSTPISWADVLNPNNIKPISLEDLRRLADLNSTDDFSVEDGSENLSLFELLEQKAEEGSILVDSSILKRWVKNSHSPLRDESEIPIPDALSAKAKRVSPLPCDIGKQILADDSDASAGEEEDYPSNDSKIERGRVRFCDDVEVNEISSESDCDSWKASDHDYSANEASNADEDQLSLHEHTVDTDLSVTLTNTSIDRHQVDLLEKTNLLKLRLADLEREIAEFQKHNAELVKLKQECEIEKIRLDEERAEFNGKLKDEEIKLELQLHDERMKLEEEKKKYEKMLKELRAKSRKEGEELSRVNEKLEQLQKENRDKDAKHLSAQARLRAQIRNLEKDLKEFSNEIDVLKKEKRRLESENARLMRNNNNKMLQEINKSIAKLVPKAAATTPDSTNVKMKPAVEKVTTHARNSTQRRQSKPAVLPNTSKPSRNVERVDLSCDSDALEENESAYFKNQNNEMDDEQSPNSESDALLDEVEIDPVTRSAMPQDEFKREILNSDGSKDIWYTNGNLKKISADGMVIRMLYYNKDIKETNINEGTVKYYYAETNTWHTTYLDGLEILEFPDGQTEHRYKDGTVEIHFENGSIRITSPMDPAKTEEWRYPDGTRLVLLKTGDKILSFPNGQKEIHTKIHKRREYPDGTVKIVYPDGSQETRYSNGRVRLKDKDGNLIMDSEQM